MSCLVKVINSLAIKKHTASIGLCETVKHLEVLGGGIGDPQLCLEQGAAIRLQHRSVYVILLHLKSTCE
jgi:hypothetical protein